LGAWRFEEVAVFYGVVNIAFALAEGIGRGFDIFPGLVRGGQFDRMLLRPRSAALQVAAQELQLMRLGRLLQGVIVLAWGMHAVGVPWAAWRVALLLFTVIGGACMFYGLFIIQATLSFWTVETLELINTMTYGGVETAQYPVTIYQPWFRRFFTFVIPLACISYFPLMAVLGREDSVCGTARWFQAASPCMGIAFIAVALCAWRFGVRKYCSTGS